MASGHEYRANRPNTWLLRPLLQSEDSSCQPGAVHTWPDGRDHPNGLVGAGLSANETARMATEPDYYIVTFETGKRPYPWRWEIRRLSSPMGVRMTEGGYQSQAAAEYAGKIALTRFLEALAIEVKRGRQG